MKKLNGLLLAAILMLTANSLMAQTYAEEALLFSRTRPVGSARILGMGGASISLGGDMSSAAINPAGLGMFNKSEFSITPGFSSISNSGTYGNVLSNVPLSRNNSDSRTSLNIPSLGLVFSKPQNDEGFIHGTFAITLQRTNDFNSNLRYSGVNNRNSLTDYFIEQANGGTVDQFASGGFLRNTPTEMAYNNFLIGPASVIDPSFPNDQYFTDFDPAVNPNVNQEETIRTKGGQNQWNFSYGANFNDKFFLGGGLGIVSLNYQSAKNYTETFTNQPIDYFTLNETLQIKGTGINLTVGGIVRPVDGLQLGATIATPTRYNITDNYSTSMSSHWFNFQYDQDNVLNNESSESDIVISSYTITTPWKFSAGASYIFGKSGLISVDVDRLDYSKAKLGAQDSDFSFDGDNSDIKRNYKASTNIRVGGELRAKQFRFRGGYNLQTNPMQGQYSDADLTRMGVSGGVGYRAANFYLDLAYMYSWNSNAYRPYTVNATGDYPLLTYDQKMSNFMATFGFIF